jgi:hypothetical protein
VVRSLRSLVGLSGDLWKSVAFLDTTAGRADLCLSQIPNWMKPWSLIILRQISLLTLGLLHLLVAATGTSFNLEPSSKWRTSHCSTNSLSSVAR